MAFVTNYYRRIYLPKNFAQSAPHNQKKEKRSATRFFQRNRLRSVTHAPNAIAIQDQVCDIVNVGLYV